MVDETVLTEWIDAKRGAFVDVIIAGRIFGGCHGESPQ